MKAKLSIIIITLVAVLISSGCIGGQTVSTTGGLEVRMIFDPQTVFSSRSSILYVDVENKESFDYNNVYVDVFSSGILKISENCKSTFDNIKPKEIKHLQCTLTAPPADQLVKQTDQETVYARVKFSKTLTATQTIDMITEEEYKREIQTGSYSTKPSSYSYSDSYMKMNILFSSELPVIQRPGTKSYMHLDITNTGDGTASDITRSDLTITEPQGKNVVNCDFQSSLTPIKKDYPRISCDLKLPAEINYINDYTTIISINYNYELRKTATLNIVR